MFKMNWNRTKYLNLPLLMVVCALTFWLASCGSGTTGDSGAVTPKGQLDLNHLKVGVPEKILDDAVLAFQLDENPISRTGGKNQYLSITKDSKGGKFIAQCKKGYCYLLQAYYMEKPITKKQALATMKGMLPSSCPEQSKVDDSQMGSDNPVVTYFFGDKYVGELILADKGSSMVKMVNVHDLEKEAAMAEDSSKAEATESKESPKE